MSTPPSTPIACGDRLLDRVQAGTAQPSEIRTTQDRYHNDFVDTDAWSEAS